MYPQGNMSHPDTAVGALVIENLESKWVSLEFPTKYDGGGALNTLNVSRMSIEVPDSVFLAHSLGRDHYQW